MGKKKYFALLIFLMFFTSQNLFAQQKKAYKAAFEYIKKQFKGTHLIVNDTIIAIPFLYFEDEISVEKRINPQKVSHLLDSVYEAQQHYRVKSTDISYFKGRGAEPTQIVYFSNINYNMFIVEVLQKNKDNDNLNFHVQARFKECHAVFVFI